MKVKIFGDDEMSAQLDKKVRMVLEELGLSEFIEVESTTDEAIKEELAIKSMPALIIEEESIDFKDTIFEGMVPEDEEIKSMFISIIGGESGGCSSDSCGTGGCSTCH